MKGRGLLLRAGRERGGRIGGKGRERGREGLPPSNCTSNDAPAIYSYWMQGLQAIVVTLSSWNLGLIYTCCVNADVRLH